MKTAKKTTLLLTLIALAACGAPMDIDERTDPESENQAEEDGTAFDFAKAGDLVAVDSRAVESDADAEVVEARKIKGTVDRLGVKNDLGEILKVPCLSTIKYDATVNADNGITGFTVTGLSGIGSCPKPFDWVKPGAEVTCNPPISGYGSFNCTVTLKDGTTFPIIVIVEAANPPKTTETQIIWVMPPKK